MNVSKIHFNVNSHNIIGKLDTTFIFLLSCGFELIKQRFNLGYSFLPVEMNVEMVLYLCSFIIFILSCGFELIEQRFKLGYSFLPVKVNVEMVLCLCSLVIFVFILS